MKPLSEFRSSNIEFVFTDIDDTLTNHGQLGSIAYDSLWRLHKSGLKVIPVTGRPAGWCEMIARFWPVSGVVGENGAFYFRYIKKRMIRHFAVDERQRAKNREILDEVILPEVLREVRGSALASDQFCRLSDLAIDFCEDVNPLTTSDVSKIIRIFEKHGATAKVSSIHVNGWFGQYDKLSMCKQFMRREFNLDLQSILDSAVFIGDSPNDEPMFQFFRHSFAVANFQNFKNQVRHLPAYISAKEGGDGFKEITDKFLEPS